MSLKEDNIEELRKYLNEHSNLTKDDLTEKVWIDVPMPLEYINEDIINELSLLEPYGKGNEKPVFADKSLIIVSFMRIGRDGKFAKMELKKITECPFLRCVLIIVTDLTRHLLIIKKFPVHIILKLMNFVEIKNCRFALQGIE